MERRRTLNELKYQRRVALYVAAFYGYAELTEWALKQGARPHEPVGTHPYRAWCQEALHADVSKCPVHAAAEAGQLLILKTFVHCSVLCLECKSPAGQTPLAIAAKHGHKDCVLYLLSKMWSTVSFLKISVPMRIYIRIKQWALRAQAHSLPRRQPRRARGCGAKVGDPVVVDGFSQPQMTSRSWHRAGSQDPQGGASKLPPLGGRAASRKPGDSAATSRGDAGDPRLRVPPLLGADVFSESRRRRHRDRMKVAPTAGREEERARRAYLPQVPLPAFPGAGCARRFHPDGPLRSCLASFRRHSGRTPRENAVYCLAVASAFKEKPWLQQLGIARALAKKSISNLTTHRGLAADENPPEILL